MGVTRDEINRIAELARLELEEGEAEALTDDLNGILRHMETLAEADEPRDSGVTQEAHRDGAAPLRDGRSDSPDRLDPAPAGIAPAWEDGFFVVPRLPALDREDPGEASADADGPGASPGADGADP